MIAHVKCPECTGKITGQMKHAIQKEHCPFCGHEIKFANALGVLAFVSVVSELNLPLGAEHLQQLVQAYFKDTLGMIDLPEILFEEDMADRVRRSGHRVQEDNLELIDSPAPQTDINPPQNLSGARRLGRQASKIQLTPAELAEIKSGLGILPIAKPSDPARMDGKTSDDTVIRWAKKSEFVRGGPTGEQQYADLDAQADVEAAKEISAYAHTKAVPVVPPLNRPVRLPNLTTPGGVPGKAFAPNAVITPKDILAMKEGA